MLSHFGVILIFLIFALILVAVSIIAAGFVRPNHPTRIKQTNYESGIIPQGTPGVLFNTRFYLVALAYIIFDVELVLLFPGALSFREMGGVSFWAMVIFVFILFLGLFYDGAKGYLDGDKPKPYIPKLSDLVDRK